MKKGGQTADCTPRTRKKREMGGGDKKTMKTMGRVTALYMQCVCMHLGVWINQVTALILHRLFKQRKCFVVLQIVVFSMRLPDLYRLRETLLCFAFECIDTMTCVVASLFIELLCCLKSFAVFMCTCRKLIRNPVMHKQDSGK